MHLTLQCLDKCKFIATKPLHVVTEVLGSIFIEAVSMQVVWIAAHLNKSKKYKVFSAIVQLFFYVYAVLKCDSHHRLLQAHNI